MSRSAQCPWGDASQLNFVSIVLILFNFYFKNPWFVRYFLSKKYPKRFRGHKLALLFSNIIIWFHDAQTVCPLKTRFCLSWWLFFENLYSVLERNVVERNKFAKLFSFHMIPSSCNGGFHLSSILYHLFSLVWQKEKDKNSSSSLSSLAKNVDTSKWILWTWIKHKKSNVSIIIQRFVIMSNVRSFLSRRVVHELSSILRKQENNCQSKKQKEKSKKKYISFQKNFHRGGSFFVGW